MSTPISRYVTPSRTVEPSHRHISRTPGREYGSLPPHLLLQSTSSSSIRVVIAERASRESSSPSCRTPSGMFHASLVPSRLVSFRPIPIGCAQDHRNASCHVFTPERCRAVCDGEWKRALCVVGTARRRVTVTVYLCTYYIGCVPW